MVACAAVAIAGISGCAVPAPAYSPSIANVSTLKNNGTAPVAVGGFSVKTGTPGASTLSVRGHPMSTAVGSDYAGYLAEALRSELELARRSDPKATIEITGVLTRNELDGDGILKGVGLIEAQFVVRREGQIKFDKVKSGSAEWESSFAGAIAIPKAVQNYPVMVQSLLAALYSDADFQAALR